MDDFWSWTFCVLLVLNLAMCSSCSVFGGNEKPKSDSELVEDMADNCKYGMKRGSVTKDDDDSEVIVDCMTPGYGI